MRSNWRKQMMISALALTLSATNVAPVFASAAPDGKTNAADIAQTMGQMMIIQMQMFQN